MFAWRGKRHFFLAGINPYRGEREYVNKGGQAVAVDPRLPLADIDPVVRSEVLLVLAELGEKVRK